MTMNGGLRRALNLPVMWKLFVKLIAYPDALERFIAQYIQPTAGMKIVDFGCGTAEILSHLPADVEYYGLDYNPKYIDDCKQRYGSRGTFICLAVGEVASVPPADIALALGVLHHLSDEEAKHLCKIASDTLRPGGKLVTLDGCYTPKQSLIQRWLLDNDRGKFVRFKEGYRKLAEPYFPVIEQNVAKAYMRLPYTHHIMTCRK